MKWEDADDVPVPSRPRHQCAPFFSFSVVGRIVPAVRMTQASKYRDKAAQESLAYREQVGWAARIAGAEIVEGPVAISVLAFAFERRWDASNVLKLAEDALNGVCYADDKQVSDARIRVFDLDRDTGDVLTVQVKPCTK